MICPKCGNTCSIDRVPSDVPGATVKYWYCKGCHWSEEYDRLSWDEEDQRLTDGDTSLEDDFLQNGD